MNLYQSISLVASGLLFLSSHAALANDHSIQVTQTTYLHPDVPSTVQIDISKLNTVNADASSFYLSLTKDSPSDADPAFENWDIDSPFSECRFAHEREITLKQRARGSLFVCDNIDALNQTGSAALTLNLTPDELTHYTLVVAVGSTGLYETLIVNPKLNDTDGDGALDQEELMAGSDKNDPNSLPVKSHISLLLLYTQDIANLYPDSLEEFFSGLEAYLNKTYSDSGVRIEINIAEKVLTELDLGPPPYEDKLADLPATMAKRLGDFEKLAALDKIHQPNIIGLIATPLTFERGRAQGILSGRGQGHFWATNDYEVIAHEMGHILGADHDIDNSFYKPNWTYNFSLGFIEPTSGVGTIMSYASTTRPIYSGAKGENCPLASCGELTLELEQGASAVDTFNLRRFFIAEAKESDSDLDGISDWFLDKYPRKAESLTSPYRCSDYDGDGYPNITEFKALTDPTLANSKPEQADVAADCPAPKEKAFQIATAINQPVELDLRQYTEAGYLINVYPELEGSIGGLSWDIYYSGLYRFTPETDFTGNAKLAFIADNGVGGKVKNTVYVKVGMENSAPSAITPSQLETTLGQTVAVEGSQSSDPDGDSISYLWKLINKPASSQASTDLGTGTNASITPDVVGEYVVELTVSDGQLSSSSETKISVKEKPVPPPVPAPESSGGGGTLSWLSLTLLMLARMRRAANYN
ncbi:M12 family metallo-peptidase [Shewanella khirikhana]|uniref:PKD domain-containing protein n=1 Tax=Shewanella khirikhana TaxID=1965282 RepID=UPI0030CFE991